MRAANVAGSAWTGRSCHRPAAAEAERCMVQIDAVGAAALRVRSEDVVMQWMEGEYERKN
jgi:hypothetical protein